MPRFIFEVMHFEDLGYIVQPLDAVLPQACTGSDEYLGYAY